MEPREDVDPRSIMCDRLGSEHNRDSQDLMEKRTTKFYKGNYTWDDGSNYIKHLYRTKFWVM